MKRSIILFAAAAVICIGVIGYGWFFVDSHIGRAAITEETVTGDRHAADGLMVGFRADSTDDLHWINSFDYSADSTKSAFSRGEMDKTIDGSVYSDIRFTGWSTVPFCTRLTYDALGDLQEKKIHLFYDELQQKVLAEGTEEKGRIRLKDYLEYYPVSFSFQFGNKLFNSDNALHALKVYDWQDILSAENASSYEADVNLYAALKNMFRIPVIENEYQEYTVSKAENYDETTELPYITDINKSSGEGEDYYEFDPIIVIQEENILDGRKWHHPDLSGGLTYDAVEDTDQSDDSYVGKSASDYDLKNRMLFVINNRTVKGEPIDVSQISQGYGIYEMPVEISATATVKQGRRSRIVPDPKPLPDQIKMVYRLDKEAEYVEMTMSEDHRYLAVFSVKDGYYLVEMIDADTWESDGPQKIFPLTEKLTYAWGDDGSLAVTNHAGYVAVLARTEAETRPYEVIYSGKAGNDLDDRFFNSNMPAKEHSASPYECNIDTGLAVAEKDGKVALVQNLFTGDPKLGVRNAALQCTIIDKNGVLYLGILKSDIVDIGYDMRDEQILQIKRLMDGDTADADGTTADDGKDMAGLSEKTVQYIIQPVINENWCRWEEQ